MRWPKTLAEPLGSSGWWQSKDKSIICFVLGISNKAETESVANPHLPVDQTIVVVAVDIRPKK